MRAHCYTCDEPRDVPVDRSVRDCSTCGGRLSAPPKERTRIERRGDGPKRTPVKQPKRKRRSAEESAQAKAWHAYARTLNGGVCVKAGCDEPADEFGHHLVEQQWLKRMGLGAHRWDFAIACPISWNCHDNHTCGAGENARVTRDELKAAGLWEPAVAWAKDLDARYFPDPVHQPVLSRLEHEYPEVPQ